MQTRTKVLIRNIVLLPVIFLVRVPLYLIYFVADAYTRTLDNYSDKIPGWDPLPLTVNQQKKFDDAKQARKDALIAAITSGR